ncbi:MAG: Dps family protein [Candidatus Nitrosotenuis sp.]
MDKVDIGLSQGTRQKVVNALSKILADQYVLYTKTRNYHWNVTGEEFSEYHKLFAEQYEALGEDIDDVAERIRSLGAKTPATLSEFIKAARLKEHPGRYPNAKAMIQNLLADHEAVIHTLRNDIELCDDVDDVGTEDFLTQLMEKHEKTAWMLRSILQR